MHAYLLGASLTPKNLTVSASVASYNAFTTAGSPTTPCAVTVTINSGVVIGGATTAAPFQTGAWPSGSTFKLIVNGKIQGFGGVGNGGAGGDAINLSLAATIDNTNGYIQGGGGGGAQGPNQGTSCGGGGGGGGEGNPGGAGGGGGSAAISGSAGGAGSTSSNGAGGTGGASLPLNGGDGGAGGTWGGAGQQSGANTDGTISTAFGAGGKAIALNGYSVTWIGGNNTTQVNGAVA